uniref:RZ-type domain-containing protein n=1 Tax=Clytia hemisphaerica TaxID=252671 RepID=A0A7M5U071_9CNID
MEDDVVFICPVCLRKYPKDEIYCSKDANKLLPWEGKVKSALPGDEQRLENMDIDVSSMRADPDVQTSTNKKHDVKMNTSFGKGQSIDTGNAHHPFTFQQRASTNEPHKPNSPMESGRMELDEQPKNGKVSTNVVIKIESDSDSAMENHDNSVIIIEDEKNLDNERQRTLQEIAKAAPKSIKDSKQDPCENFQNPNPQRKAQTLSASLVQLKESSLSDKQDSSTKSESELPSDIEVIEVYDEKPMTMMQEHQNQLTRTVKEEANTMDVKLDTSEAETHKTATSENFKPGYTNPTKSSKAKEASNKTHEQQPKTNQQDNQKIIGHQHQYKTQNNQRNQKFDVKFVKYTSTELCEVDFYVAIPSGMKTRVFVTGGFHREGQWNAMLTEMKAFEKIESLGLDLLFGKVSIPCYLLKRKIPYKYCLLPEDSQEIIHEDIETNFPESYRNRLFEVSIEEVQDGHLAQFDDVILLGDSLTFFERGKNWIKGMVGMSSNKKHFRKRQDYNCKLFLYHFNRIFRLKDHETKMKLLNHLSRCFLNSKTELRNTHLSWEKIDANNKQLEVFTTSIGKVLEKNVQALVPTSSNIDQIDALMESMSFVVFISNMLENHKKFIKTDLILVLMESLSMEHLSMESHELFLQRLKEVYHRKPLRFILDKLVIIWKTFMSYPKVSTSVKWLYPLVLMHELDKLLDAGMNNNDLKDTDELTLRYCGLFNLGENCLPSSLNNSRNLDGFFEGIKHVAGSLKKDTILQRALVYMMQPKHLIIGFQFGFKKRMVLRKALSFVKWNSFAKENEVCTALKALDKQIQDVERKDLCLLVVLLLDFLATVLGREFLQLTTTVLDTTLNALKTVQEFIDELEPDLLHSFQNRTAAKEPTLMKVLHDFTSYFGLRHKTCNDVESFLHILFHLERVTLFSSEFVVKWRKKLHKRTAEFLDDLCRYKEKIFLEIYLEAKLDGFILQNFDEAFEKNIDKFLTAGVLESTLAHRRTSIFLGKKIKDLWEKHNTDKDRFEWMMGWNPFKVVFKHYWNGNDKTLEGIMETCSNIILNHCHELNDQNVTIKNLKSIKQYRERFFQILDIVVESVDSVSEIKANFEQRSKEMEAYKEAFNVISYLNEFLLKLSEQIGDLRIFRNKMQTNADSLKLIDIYKKGTDSISYFDVDPRAQPLLKLFLKSDMASSVIFQQLWKSTLNAAASKERILGFESQFTDVNEKALFQMSFKVLLSGITIPDNFSLPFNLQQIILYLLLPTLNQTYDLLVDLCGGSISIGEALKYYEQFQSATSFAKELTQLKTFFEADFTERSIKKCHQRIKCADTMKDCVEQSNAILETASVLGLCGNFKSVELIKAKATANEDTLLNAITDDLIKDTKKVINTSDEMKQIFKAVAHNLNILQWLKRHLKDAKEVKVFVEMMSIAAGESDYEVDRVAYFEASCQAFSAIIFDLDQNSGYEEFEEACKRAAEAVKNDPTIIEKLNDSNKNLEWFKQAKESQGSVSARSFLEAKKANSNGKYIIGNLNGKAEFFFEQTAALHHVVKLKIVYEDDQVQSKELSLDDVHDLQSRLMLLGRDNNKTEENIKEGIAEKEYFVKQAEIITRLADAYVRLIEAGDIQYLNWKKEYQCNVEEAKQRTFEEYFREIEIEIEKFERRLESWNAELMQFRMENPYANHFSVKQMLVLRKYLKQYSSGSAVPEINNQVFTLLRSISEEVTVKKVKECCLFMHSSASKSPIKNDKKKLEDNETNFTRFTYKELDALIQKFLNENDDIEKDVVLASLMQVPDFRIEKKVILWCGKHEDDEDLIEELSEKAEAELEKMKETIYLSSDGEDCEMEIIDHLEKDYLPLDLFGNFLNQFGTITHHRSIPTYLQKHQPNLIILPRDEILASVIAMYDNDGSASLPSSSEVLLCSDDVSLEQVEMLIIRAALTEDGMFCLAFAEHLNYENSEKVFGFLQKIMKEKNMGYLVVICSSEEENQSYLASALDSYQRQCVHRKRDISSILSKAFCLKEEIEHNKKVMYGPTVDEDSYNVRVISSTRGGMGKSLMIDRKCHQLDYYTANSATTIQKERFQRYQTLVRTPVHGTAVCYEDVVSKLAENSIFDADFPRIYHFDVAPTVQEGLDILFFNVFVLGSMQTKTGKVWRKNNNDMCYVEMTKISSKTKDGKSSAGVMLQNLPHTECASPEEALRIRRGQPAKMIFEESELRSSQFQRVFQYLQRYEANPKSLNDFDYEQNKNIQINVVSVLEVLLRYCGIPDPSWMELRNFVHFFNQNLLDCERSVFTSVYLRADFPGFRTFVVTFLLEMARDFATRSLDQNDRNSNNNLVQFKRTWEQSAHPYLFFNTDGNSMTFFGINITPNFDLIDPQTQIILKQKIIEQQLYQILDRQMAGDFVNFKTNFNSLSKLNKIKVLCRVMGLPETDFDPDPTYELTIDNMKKMLAIHMRLRCGVPVVLMGETGCGKTTLIRFMCSLCAGPAAGNQRTPKNMLLVKVHGGITMEDIELRVKKAMEMASQNLNSHTVLFLDEANTTDAIGLIKEVMVDKMLFGKPLAIAQYGLDIIAACNPYRQHTNEMIKKLETAGLGYHVGAVDTYEKIGEIPLRQLVYRVHPLPESMKPLVWDFGQLNSETEQLYARQIVKRYKADGKLPLNDDFVDLLIKVLAESQLFMRNQKDECSFVSLRDVERAVQVTSWFHQKMGLFLPLIKEFEEDRGIPLNLQTRLQESIEKQRRSLILALAVCYIARLEDRNDYYDYIEKLFTGDFALQGGVEQFKNEIKRFQEMFINQLHLEDNIAKNQALCENVFMMVICIELRIPLFVVGKPGSSKSLAKTIVQDNMQGKNSKCKLFQNFKQVFMSSYQCSPLSTADGIIGVFKQSARFQEQKNLDEYTSVVVLDEVGLAEDSPRMPLKALHPLLEDGTDGSEDLTMTGSDSKSKRVAFIGISNWALDPAKMNRGIMLSRSPPAFDELANTARDICASKASIQNKISPLLKQLSHGYIGIYKVQRKTESLKQFKKEEFFGLRDFYSLIKLVFCLAKKYDGKPPTSEIKNAICRNFSGMNEIEPWPIFKKSLELDENEDEAEDEEENEENTMSTVDMIRKSFEPTCACSTSTNNNSNNNQIKKRCTSNRYLLVMTEKYSALPIIEGMSLDENMTVIFGSSFPKDQEFTQVCRDINRIKMCMETGRTVILLNMENLYESLYDALNQYYVYMGGQRYVDLGLGTHRVKCRVHEDFKLIVMADKTNVYKTFPIPLINRLEKHFLVTATAMSPNQLEIEWELTEWANHFAKVSSERKKFDCEDAFIGYNNDTCASIIIELYRHMEMPSDKEILDLSKKKLLQVATPDSMARLPKDEREKYWNLYFEEQTHSSLPEFLCKDIILNKFARFYQITTFSRLLSPQELEKIEVLDFQIEALSLMQFQTENSFREALRSTYQKVGEKNSIILVQYSLTKTSGDLVPCAQHITKEIASQVENGDNVKVVFLLQLTRGAKSLVSYQSIWECIHIDEIRQDGKPKLINYIGKPISSLFEENYDWFHLIQSSVQGAVEIVNKKSAMKADVITKKINILNQMLHRETKESMKFAQLIMQQMFARLLEGEQKAADKKKVANWVPQEAVELRYIPNYGTFGEALVRCVEEKVCPILGDLVYELDFNNNLMLIANSLQFIDLWLELFEVLVCATSRNDVSRFPKRIENCQFPFSQHIMVIMDNMINENHQPDSMAKTCSILQSISQAPFGEVLLQCGQHNLMRYLKDFVVVNFHGLSQELFEVLSECLLIEMNKLVQEINKANIETEEDQEMEENSKTEYFQSIPMLHLTYERCKDSFANAIQLLRTLPHLIQGVFKNLESGNPLDIIALNEFLNDLLPEDDPIEDVKVYAAIKGLKKTIQAILLHCERDELRLKWAQVKMLHLFVNDVIYSSSKPQKISGSLALNALYQHIQGLPDAMTSKQSWIIFETFLKETVIKKEGDEELDMSALRENCLQFFIDVVVEFCFSKEAFERIDQETVIPHIMGYAFTQNAGGGTKRFSPVEDYAIDDSPVIRSFILQQLLSREVEVQKYVEDYLDENLRLIQRNSTNGQDEADIWNMCKIFIYCYQDHLTNTVFNVYKKNGDFTRHYLNHVSTTLSDVREFFTTPRPTNTLDVKLLEMIAQTRVCLSACADILSSEGSKFIEEKAQEKEDRQLKREQESVVASLGLLVKDIKNTDVHMFLHRQMIHVYGKQELHNVINEHSWLALDTPENKQNNTNYDRYLIYDKSYKDARMAISEFLLHPDDNSTLHQVSASKTKDFVKELATLHFDVFSDIEIDQQYKDTLIKEMKLKNLDNYLAMAGQNSDKNILEFLYHLAVVLKHSKSDFIALFKALTNSPQTLKDSYLPTMPSDNFEAIEAVMPTNGYNKFTRHECSCGYPYVITECGNPNQEFTCPECKQPIGGTNYKFVAGQKTNIANRDNTKHGHCLGDAQNRSLDAIPERELTRISVVLQQILIHISMLLGYLKGHQMDINALITPNPNKDVIQFFTEHVLHDLYLIKKGLNLNEDGAKLVVHLLLKLLMKNTNKNGVLQAQYLSTKQGRITHEKAFDQHIIRKFLETYVDDLNNYTNLLIKDDRSLQSVLMRHLYEVEFPYQSTINDVQPARCFQLWGYWSTINLASFRLVVQQKAFMAQVPVSVKQLAKFVENEDIISKVKELPKIIQLHEIMTRNFNFRVNKKTAQEQTLEDAIKTTNEDFKKFKRLVKDVSKMWKELKSRLQKHGRVVAEDCFNQDYSMKTPLEYFLLKPEGRGSGLLALAKLLVLHQNEILAQYKDTQGSLVHNASLSNVKDLDLVNYSAEADLLPLVYTNCDYSLELGKGTKEEYNLEKISQHLTDKLFYGKSMIRFEMKEFVYLDDVHSARKFTNLKRNVDQTNISFGEQRKMVMELKEISDVTHALNAVEISIGFLTSTITPVDKDQFYHKYLQNSLKMNVEKHLPSRTMRGTLRLKHLYSAWLMLTIERAIRLDMQDQNPFDCPDRYCLEMSDDLENKMKNILRHLDSFELICLLTEYLVCGDINSMPDNAVDLSLADSLQIYEDMNEKSTKVESVENIPEEILLKNLFHFWRIVAKAYQKKKDEV